MKRKTARYFRASFIVPLEKPRVPFLTTTRARREQKWTGAGSGIRNTYCDL
jgi:hypothetical protein